MESHYNRAVRKHQIIDAVFQFNRGGHWPSVYQISRYIGLAPSSHVRKMVNELVTDGVFTLDVVDHRPKVTKTVYWLLLDGLALYDPNQHADIHRAWPSLPGWDSLPGERPEIADPAPDGYLPF